MTRLLVALLWLLHWLPLGVLAPIGRGLGALLYALARRRRHIATTNLRLCFPDLDDAQVKALCREHFKLVGRSILERGIQWWGSRDRIERLVRVTGVERVKDMLNHGEHVILLIPHFLGLDLAGSGVGLHLDTIIYYSRQRNRVVDHYMRLGRARFGNQLLLERTESLRRVVREMRGGRPFYYLPDMDFGRKESIFVPFFGVQAATIEGLPRLAKMAPAHVVPLTMRMLPGGQGYEAEFSEPWTDYPTQDARADVIRMNAWIEDRVREMPAQYYWVHRRFKTRPEGEPGVY